VVEWLIVIRSTKSLVGIGPGKCSIDENSFWPHELIECSVCYNNYSWKHSSNERNTRSGSTFKVAVAA
jgi:hypothetical protein